MIRPSIICLFILCLNATNDIDLGLEAILAVGSNATASSMSYSADGTLLVVATNPTVSFFRRNSNGLLDVPHKVSVAYLIQQVAVKNDGSHVAVAADYYVHILSNLNGITTNHVLAQTIYIRGGAASITWAADGQRLIVGSYFGSVYVFGRYATNQYKQRQQLNTSHSWIAHISGAKSRFVTCGSDTKLTIFYYNTTDGMYSVNQTIEQVAGGGCTSLDFSPLENRIASGRTDGTVAILRRDANFNYAVSNKLIASEIFPVSIVKWSGDSVYLLASLPYDKTIKLWSAANNFASPITNKTISGQSGDFSQDVFAIGTYDIGGLSYIYRLNASNCEYATTGNSSVCNCTPGRIWQNGNCSALDCSTLLNSPRVVNASNSSICGCNDGFVYNSVLMECQRNCSEVTNSNGSNYEYSSCFCVKGYQWSYPQSRCRIICVGMVGSSGENVDDTTCVCNSGFIWNGSLCGVNCSIIPNSNDRRISPNCSCNAGFVWNRSAIACWASCIRMIGSNGTNANSTVCYCMPNFNWDTGTSSCLINCTSAPNSDGTNATVSSCNCKNGFVWNYKMGACSVNCTNITNSNNSNDGLNSCSCNKDYIYAKKGVCEAIINCTTLLNSPGTNFNQSWCNCNEGYIFWPTWLGATESVCQLNCSRFTRTNISRGTGNYETCTCIMGYNWTGNKCSLNCSAMKYGKQTVGSDTVCSCREGYQWDQIIGQCLVIISDNTLQIAMGLGISFGVLLLIGLAVMFACYWKKRKNTKIRNALVSSRSLPTSAVFRRNVASQSETNIIPFQSTSMLESPDKRIPQPSEYTQNLASYPAVAQNMRLPSKSKNSQSRPGTNSAIPSRDYEAKHDEGNQGTHNPDSDNKNQLVLPTVIEQPSMRSSYQFIGGQENSRVGNLQQAGRENQI